LNFDFVLSTFLENVSAKLFTIVKEVLI